MAYVLAMSQDGSAFPYHVYEKSDAEARPGVAVLMEGTERDMHLQLATLEADHTCEDCGAWLPGHFGHRDWCSTIPPWPEE